MRTVSMALVALLAGCDSEGMDPEPTQSRPAWLTTTWNHDEGREGYADYADYSIRFERDGTYVWNHAVSILDGEWRYPGHGSIYLDGERKDLEHSKGCRVMTLHGKTYLSQLATVTGCPTTPAPLSALEKCLVGEFTGGTANGGVHSFKFEADRTATDFYDDPGYTSGGGSYTVYGEFKLLANGDVEFARPDGDPEARTAVESLIGMQRKGAVAAGCDMTSFTRLGGGGGGGSGSGSGSGGGGSTCTKSCGSGYACDEYEGIEGCCSTSYPYYCPDAHACYTTAAARDAACATSYYGDPSFGCEAGQVSTTISGAAGSYCAPSCNGSGSFCPSSIDGQAGACAISQAGSSTASLCALRCTDIGVTEGQCPNAMKCTAAASGNGYCLFP